MTEWISIKDRLPNQGEQVLTYDTQLKEYRIDYLLHFDNEPEPYIWACRLVSDWNRVNYWMQLPEKPKDKS